MSSSPLHSCPSLPHRPCHHVFSISLALSLSLRLSCCAVVRWIDPWLASRFCRLIDTRAPRRERPAGWCVALLKELFYPRESSKEAREQERERKCLKTYLCKRNIVEVTMMTLRTWEQMHQWMEAYWMHIKNKRYSSAQHPFRQKKGNIENSKA